MKPLAVDYFFAATLQQFSFWSARDNRYHQPLIAQIGGVRRKGSDYLWAALTRRPTVDAAFCAPERQADLSREELLDVFRSDHGQDPMPALDLHLEQAHQYGRDMLSHQLTPQSLLGRALSSTQPLQTFLTTLDHIGGYKEDPLRKKSLLLAMILNDRPETFCLAHNLFLIPRTRPVEHLFAGCNDYRRAFVRCTGLLGRDPPSIQRQHCTVTVSAVPCDSRKATQQSVSDARGSVLSRFVQSAGLVS